MSKPEDSNQNVPSANVKGTVPSDNRCGALCSIRSPLVSRNLVTIDLTRLSSVPICHQLCPLCQSLLAGKKPRRHEKRQIPGYDRIAT